MEGAGTGFLRSPKVSRVQKAKYASNLRKAPRKRLLRRLILAVRFDIRCPILLTREKQEKKSLFQVLTFQI